MIECLGDVLSDTLAGERASWVFERLLGVAEGGDPPTDAEIAEQYASSWLAEVPTGSASFTELAPMIAATVAAHEEQARTNEARVLLELADGSFRRFRCAVETSAPHRISFQLVCTAVAPGTAIDRTVEGNGRSVHVRDYGGEGPLLLLWHGSGCDATIWDGIVPYLRSCRVIAQDLPGHGASLHPHLSVTEAIADTEVVLDELDLGDPILAGHSSGGWIALHFAADSGRVAGLICLDGPAALDYAAMHLRMDHPGFLPDPPDVVADLDAIRCPTLIALCGGASPAESEWMVPFRQGLSDHIVRLDGPVRADWQPTGHMMVLSHPEQTASLITDFIDEH